MIWLLACAPEVMDSATEELVDCALAPLPSGELVDVMDCTEGVCEVAAGTSWMGAPDIEDACPARYVELGAYAIDQQEATVSKWNRCVSEGDCVELDPACESEAEVENAERTPATCISWDEASDYCAWAGGRLPTEAEWEKAARGDEGADWAWGAEPPSCLVANYRYAASYCHYGVIEVGSFPSVFSSYGLLDSVGNAWEWTQDWYGEDSYAELGDVDPVLDADCVEDEVGDCTFRAIRGGAFNTTVENTRAASRSFTRPDTRDDNLGVRCAYDR